MTDFSRRGFLQSAASAAAVGALEPKWASASSNPQHALTRPVAIASANGLGATRKAVEMIHAGADTLDAVVTGVNPVAEDPEDTSVGCGGLPNRAGVVELDSFGMHGATIRAGVGAARRAA